MRRIKTGDTSDGEKGGYEQENPSDTKEEDIQITYQCCGG
jgi:hypothetical protein